MPLAAPGNDRIPHGSVCKQVMISAVAKQAGKSSPLTFYINRAGRPLPSGCHRTLEAAEQQLRAATGHRRAAGAQVST